MQTCRLIFFIFIGIPGAVPDQATMNQVTETEPAAELPSPSAAPTLWTSFLPTQWRKVIREGDQEWIARLLYTPDKKLKQLSGSNWFEPPVPRLRAATPPEAADYFRQKVFLWAPMRMWGIPLKCPECRHPLTHSGIYPRAREVLDLESRWIYSSFS